MGFVLDGLLGSETVLNVICNARRGSVPFATSVTVEVTQRNPRVLRLPLGYNEEVHLATASRDMAVMCHWLVGNANHALCKWREKIAN